MKNTDKGVRTEEEILFQVQSCERMGGLRLNLLGRAEAPRLMGRGLNRDEIDGDMAARAFYWLKSVAGAGARRPLRRARAHPNARPSPRSTDVCHRDPSRVLRGDFRRARGASSVSARRFVATMARVALSSLYPPSCFFLTDRIRRASGTPLTSPLPRRSQPRARGARPARRSVVATAEKSAKKDEKAKLPKEYKHHSPGSVQETDDVVVFAHQGEDADKWEATAVHHVGDESDAPVRLGVVIGEFHNKLMDLMLEDARVAAADMVRPDPTPILSRTVSSLRSRSPSPHARSPPVSRHRRARRSTR